MEIRGFLASRICLCLVVLVLASAPMAAQTLVATPAGVAFTYNAGQKAPEPVTVVITTSSGSTPSFTASLASSSGTPATLFALSPSGSTIQVGIEVAALESLLNSPGIYTATITVTASGFSNLTIPVTLTLGEQLTVQALPAALTFNLPSAQTSQTVSLTGTTVTQVPFTFTIATTTGGDWLSATASATSTPATLTVTVNPGSLTPGTYNGTITVNGNLNIPVTFVLGVNTLTASPGSFAFSFTAGGTIPPADVLMLSSTLTPNTFTAQASSTGNWLLVNGVTSVVAGALPANLNITVNPTGLAAGNYQGSIAVTSGDGSVQNVTVTLVVNGLSQIANPTSLVFVAQAGGASPATQFVLVNQAPNVTYTAAVLSGAAWLSVSPSSGSLPAQLTATVNSTALAAGTYSGTIQVSLNSSHSQTIEVSLTVSANPVLTTSSGTLLFDYFSGNGAPPPVTLNVTVSSGSQQAYTLAGGLPPWLQASVVSNEFTTPSSIDVAVVPESLSNGLYLADIILTPTAQGGVQVVVPVLLTVSGATPLITNVTSLTFSSLAGGSPQSQVIQASASVSTSFIAAANTTSGGSWLSVSPASGTAGLMGTPLTVTANAASLAVGTYQGTITLTTSEGVVTQVAVTFNVGNSTLSVSPSTLAFAYTQGGALPDTQTVQVSGTQSFTASASATSGGTWLSVSPGSGTGNASLTVTANPAGLAAGTYNGSVIVTPATGAAQTVAVTLTVTGGSLAVTQNSLAFSYISGNPSPAPQTVGLSASSAVAFTVTASSSGWLSVTPLSGTTPATLTVSVNTTDLGAGAYTGTIVVNGQITITVSLSVTSPLPVINAVVNAASYLGGGIAPGEIVTVFGTFLGPSTGQGATVTNGFIGTALANVQVTFNGYPGPLLYVSAGQINTIVPYELAGASNALVEVIFGKASSNVVLLPVVSSAPGIFSANASGTGPGAILDKNNNLVTASNPVSPGSVIQIFATGQGQTNPAGIDGLIEPLVGPWPSPTLAPGVMIGNLPANTTYVGAAPGLVAGALQINAVIPDGVASGAVPVIVFIGPNGSQAGITVSVQ